MRSFLSWPLYWVALFTASSTAYWIDPVSCGAFGTARLIPQVNSAFNLAADSLQALNNLNNGNAWQDQNKRDLANWIFGNQAAEAQRRFNLLNSAGVDNLNLNEPSQNDIKIYCDESRLVSRTFEVQGRVIDTNRAYDPENRAFLKEKFGQTPCSKSISTSTAAYTFRKESQTLSIITICPAYLNEFKVVKYTGIQAVQAFMWNKASSALQKTLTTFNRRKIDLAALFDITMLHELMHTRQGGGASDGTKPQGDNDGYGWQKIRQLSTTATGAQSADSLAYWGLGVRLISDQQNPKRILENGNVIKVQ